MSQGPQRQDGPSVSTANNLGDGFILKVLGPGWFGGQQLRIVPHPQEHQGTLFLHRNKAQHPPRPRPAVLGLAALSLCPGLSPCPGWPLDACPAGHVQACTVTPARGSHTAFLCKASSCSSLVSPCTLLLDVRALWTLV